MSCSEPPARRDPFRFPTRPVIRTVLLVFAIVSIILNRSSIASLRPMMLQNSCDVLSVRLSRTFSCLICIVSTCCRTLIRSSSMLNGFVK